MSSNTSCGSKRKLSLAAIAEIVSEFSGINRSPNFKKPPPSGSSSGNVSPARKNSEPPTGRRYSVVVAVGVNPVPQPQSDEKIKLI
uniref:Uncharacterized protein n=1 Tax=Caenorhabditis japonica TaxID=281687 RepID=A0A8R1IDA1_CAEJA